MATTADIVDFVEEGALDSNHRKGKQVQSLCFQSRDVVQNALL